MFVPITTKLISAVSSQIHRLQNTELGAEPLLALPELSGLEPWGALALWGVLRGTEFERNVTLTCDCAREISFIITDGTHLDGSGPMVKKVRSPGVPRVVYVDPDGTRRYNDISVSVVMDDHPFFRAYVEAQRSRGEIEARWKKVGADIGSFLRASKSLNEALKLWPDIARYVDSSLVDKVNEKIVKKDKPVSEAVAKLAAMDMDAITSSTVIARLITANGASQ